MALSKFKFCRQISSKYRKVDGEFVKQLNVKDIKFSIQKKNTQKLKRKKIPLTCLIMKVKAIDNTKKKWIMF